jgi:exosome complex RNA-binding protein Rrp42 (RNase PH superfamily)
VHRVLVVVSCEVVKPYPDRPTEGFFKFNISFSPMASPAFGGRVSSQGVEIGRIVERGLRESGAIDTEALCIIAGEKVWSVRLDMHVLDDHGNLTDCCGIGAITALHHFRRPDVTISGDAVIVHSAKERDPVGLSIHHMPISVTFSIFGEDTLVVDPSWKEEHCCNGKMTITLNAQHEMCAMQKAGGVALSVQKILEATLIAQVKVLELSEAIHSALHKDKLSRKTDNVSSSHLMTCGIGLEETIQDEINLMESKSEAPQRAIRFFQGLQSLDMPNITSEDNEYDSEAMDAIDAIETKQEEIPTKSGSTSKASSSVSPATPAAASPKKGPIVVKAKTAQKPTDILKAATGKPKAIIPSKVAKQEAAAAESSVMDVDKDSPTTSSSSASENKDERRDSNKKSFESFAAALAEKSKRQKVQYKRHSKSTANENSSE